MKQLFFTPCSEEIKILLSLELESVEHLYSRMRLSVFLYHINFIICDILFNTVTFKG